VESLPALPWKPCPRSRGISARDHVEHATYARTRDFIRDFRKALAPAVTAYPEARVEVDDDGLVLHPSRPPVAPKLISIRAT
jgi:hypothetical protein